MPIHQGHNSLAPSPIGVTLNIHLPNASSATTPTPSVPQVDGDIIVLEVAGTFDTSTKSSNALAISPEMYHEILARLGLLERQATISTDQIKLLNDHLQEEKEKVRQISREKQDLEMKLQVEREEHHLISLRFLEDQARIDELQIKLGELESKQEQSDKDTIVDRCHFEEMESRMMKKLQLKMKTEEEEGDKELNKRLLSIKNATQDAISQIRKTKKDTKKEDDRAKQYLNSIKDSKNQALSMIRLSGNMMESRLKEKEEELNLMIKEGHKSLEYLKKEISQDFLRQLSNTSLSKPPPSSSPPPHSRLFPIRLSGKATGIGPNNNNYVAPTSKNTEPLSKPVHPSKQKPIRVFVKDVRLGGKEEGNRRIDFDTYLRQTEPQQSDHEEDSI
ncbi:hypothetical protein I203_105160 [Kwoniella mangroviensis CBS 8507]|uniref:uncharacterized protein n=1 Tax=Kwoniella mangroviensis CBS 8507 TaxID=1296122 RepID=UPI00080D8226|nr:uncharacterized protein I203_00981 [Kwoniella mangroviensis CBS 8507]OCF69128.1 hypothetical protein I203_00981 [Kwoniella mangroviensis CBS 8507]